MIAQRLEAQVILKKGIFARTQDFNVNKTNSYRKKEMVKGILGTFNECPVGPNLFIK